jgi:serine/threonine-protein kinase RsbW
MVHRPVVSDTIPYGNAADLAAVRAFVRARALAQGLAAERVELLLLAVNELTTNTVQHTAGGGHVRVWADTEHLVCDVVDGGPVPMFGRSMPAAEATRGRGLAIVERVCDRVSAVPVPDGTMISLRLRRR